MNTKGNQLVLRLSRHYELDSLFRQGTINFLSSSLVRGRSLCQQAIKLFEAHEISYERTDKITYVVRTEMLICIYNNNLSE